MTRPYWEGIIVKFRAFLRPLVGFLTVLCLVFAGGLFAPVNAGNTDNRGLGKKPARDQIAARSSDAYVFREHSTANHERVDLREFRIDKVWNQHKVNFTALVRVVEWARSPRMRTSPDGIDRGVYRYKIYEYVSDNGGLEKTGRWVILQTVIEWGDGANNRGWMVTTYPVETQSGNPPKDAQGKTYCPAWLAETFAVGPVNNEILY